MPNKIIVHQGSRAHILQDLIKYNEALIRKANQALEKPEVTANEKEKETLEFDLLDYNGRREFFSKLIKGKNDYTKHISTIIKDLGRTYVYGSQKDAMQMALDWLAVNPGSKNYTQGDMTSGSISAAHYVAEKLRAITKDPDAGELWGAGENIRFDYYDREGIPCGVSIEYNVKMPETWILSISRGITNDINNCKTLQVSSNLFKNSEGKTNSSINILDDALKFLNNNDLEADLKPFLNEMIYTHDQRENKLKEAKQKLTKKLTPPAISVNEASKLLKELAKLSESDEDISIKLRKKITNLKAQQLARTQTIIATGSGIAATGTAGIIMISLFPPVSVPLYLSFVIGGVFVAVTGVITTVSHLKQNSRLHAEYTAAKEDLETLDTRKQEAQDLPNQIGPIQNKIEDTKIGQSMNADKAKTSQIEKIAQPLQKNSVKQILPEDTFKLKENISLDNKDHTDKKAINNMQKPSNTVPRNRYLKGKKAYDRLLTLDKVDRALTLTKGTLYNRIPKQSKVKSNLSHDENDHKPPAHRSPRK